MPIHRRVLPWWIEPDTAKLVAPALGDASETSAVDIPVLGLGGFLRDLRLARGRSMRERCRVLTCAQLRQPAGIVRGLARHLVSRPLTTIGADGAWKCAFLTAPGHGGHAAGRHPPRSLPGVRRALPHHPRPRGQRAGPLEERRRGARRDRRRVRRGGGRPVLPRAAGPPLARPPRGGSRAGGRDTASLAGITRAGGAQRLALRVVSRCLWCYFLQRKSAAGCSPAGKPLSAPSGRPRAGVPSDRGPRPGGAAGRGRGALEAHSSTVVGSSRAPTAVPRSTCPAGCSPSTCETGCWRTWRANFTRCFRAEVGPLRHAVFSPCDPEE